MGAHGKNISKCRSIKDGVENALAFIMLYQKDSPLRRRSECIAFVTLYQKDGPLRSSEYLFAKCML